MPYPRKLAPPLAVNQYVTYSPSPILPTTQVLRTKDSLSWLSGRHTLVSPAFGLHTSPFVDL